MGESAPIGDSVTELAFGRSAWGAFANLEVLDFLRREQPVPSYLLPDIPALAMLSESRHSNAKLFCSLLDSQIFGHICIVINLIVSKIVFINLIVKSVVSWYTLDCQVRGSATEANHTKQHTTTDSSALTGYHELDTCGRLGRFAFKVEDR
jgi:hypothetical protein